MVSILLSNEMALENTQMHNVWKSWLTRKKKKTKAASDNQDKDINTEFTVIDSDAGPLLISLNHYIVKLQTGPLTLKEPHEVEGCRVEQIQSPLTVQSKAVCMLAG